MITYKLAYTVPYRDSQRIWQLERSPARCSD